MITKFIAVGALALGCTALVAAPALAATTPQIKTHVTERLALGHAGQTMNLSLSGQALNVQNIPLPAGFTVQLVGHPANKNVPDKVLTTTHTDFNGRYALRLNGAPRGWTYAAKLLPGQQMSSHYAGSIGQRVLAK
jgi:hypothetical protein